MSTAPALHIGKLRNRFVSDGELDQAQMRQWQEAFAEQEPADLVGRVVSDDEWLLIRRLPLHVRWDTHTAATEVGHVWLQALQQAVQHAASAPDPLNVLRYRVWRHGLTDLLYRSALGEVDRQWAWQRMGLIDREGLPASEALQQGAFALLNEPDLIWPVLHHALQAEGHTGAFTAMARCVPSSMWTRWLQAAPQSSGWMRAWHAAVQASFVDDDQATSIAANERDNPAQPATAIAATNANVIEEHVHAQALLNWVRRHPQLAQKLGDTLTVWLAALVWRDVGSAHAASHRLAAVRQAWQQAAHVAVMAPARQSSRVPSAASPWARDAGKHAAASVQAAGLHADATPPDMHPAAPMAQADRTLPEAPALPDPDHTLLTAWAGAVFFLRLLAAPDVLSTLHAQAGLSPDEPKHTTALVQAVAMALRVPTDDPVMSVMTAGQPWQEIAPVTQAAANRLVAQWAQWLDDALPDAPEPRLPWVCQRPGRLQLEPGWIELHLDMDQIDTRLRRVGLDVDPGWVPCIGAVVRICYD